MTATLQNEAAEKARQQAVKAKATVDEAISWLRSAATSYDTADQAHEAMACMPTILSLMAISTEIGELSKRLENEEQA